MTSKSAGPGVIALVLGILGIVVPFLPIDLINGRGLLALPFGLVGLVFALIGCTGGRRGMGVAIAGLVLCVLALAIGIVMLTGAYHYSG